MARNKQDHTTGNVFVPSTSFPEAEAKSRGPERPVPNDPGGSIEIVQRGTAFGGVIGADGARDMSKVRMKKLDKETFKPGLPENA